MAMVSKVSNKEGTRTTYYMQVPVWLAYKILK